jgi:O-antigen/teichoic acid export membrane protein
MEPSRASLTPGRVALNATANSIGTIGSLAIWFLLTPFILRHLGERTYGIYALIGSIVGHASILELSVGSAVTRYVANYRATGRLGEATALIATALRFYTFVGLVVASAAIGAAIALPRLLEIAPQDLTVSRWLLILMGVQLACSIAGTASFATLRGLQRFDVLNALALGSAIASAITTVVILARGGGVVAMAGSSLFFTVAVQAAAVWTVPRLAPGVHVGWRGARRHLFPQILSFSAPLLVSDVASRVQTRSGEILVGALVALPAVAVFWLARRLSEIPVIITDQVTRVLLPAASVLDASSDLQRLRTLMLTGTRITLALAVPACSVLAMLSGSLLTLWLGAGYAVHGHLLATLAVASLVEAGQWSAGAVLQGMNRHRPLVFVDIAAGVLGLSLAFALRGLGVAGVAVAMLIASVVKALAMTFPYVMHVLHIRVGQLWRAALVPVGTAAIPLLATLWVASRLTDAPFWLAAAAIVGGASFAVTYLAFETSRRERELLRQVVARLWSFLGNPVVT